MKNLATQPLQTPTYEAESALRAVASSLLLGIDSGASFRWGLELWALDLPWNEAATNGQVMLEFDCYGSKNAWFLMAQISYLMILMFHVQIRFENNKS